MFEWSIFTAKIVGAITGSSVAVVFRPGQDTKAKLLKRLILGAIIGFIFCPLLMGKMEFPNTIDYVLASACFMGLCGYVLLRLLYSRMFERFLLSKLPGESNDKRD